MNSNDEGNLRLLPTYFAVRFGRLRGYFRETEWLFDDEEFWVAG